MQLNVELPKHAVGTKFTYRRGKFQTEATVVGYHIEHNTENDSTNVTYRIAYNFAGLQDMVATVARSTVDMALLQTA